MNNYDTANYLNIYDNVYDFGLHIHYSRPSYQIEQLKTIGFNTIQIFALITGKELMQTNELSLIKDSWIYYLCRN